MKKYFLFLFVFFGGLLLNAQQIAKEFEAFHRDAMAKAHKDQAAYDALENEANLLEDRWPNTQGDEWRRISKRLDEIMLAQIEMQTTLNTDVMNSWIGAHSDDLLEKWGPPDSTFKDTKGNTIWTFQRIKGYGANAHEITRQFYINRKNIIYDWKWEGM